MYLGTRERGFGLWCGRLGGGAARLDLLLRAGLFPRSGVHPGIRMGADTLVRACVTLLRATGIS